MRAKFASRTFAISIVLLLITSCMAPVIAVPSVNNSNSTHENNATKSVIPSPLPLSSHARQYPPNDSMRPVPPPLPFEHKMPPNESEFFDLLARDERFNRTKHLFEDMPEGNISGFPYHRMSIDADNMPFEPHFEPHIDPLERYDDKFREEHEFTFDPGRGHLNRGNDFREFEEHFSELGYAEQPVERAVNKNDSCSVVSLSSNTIYVPDEYATIQAAVDAASAGDTIIVRDGSYIENINVNKRLTIRSENGSANCIVDAASSYYHVFEVHADYVNLSGFTVTGATGSGKGGIYLWADHCKVSDNNAFNNDYGIYLRVSSDSTLTNNTANLNHYGIYLRGSSDNTLTNNTMSNNDYNFGVYGWLNLSRFINNIDTTNKVDGKPVYYWVNQQNQQIPDDAGYVGVVNSTNITVKDVTLKNNSQGVLFAYTSNSRIENVNVANNYDGIYLYSSSDNYLTNNIANSNHNYGIYLDSSCDNNLTNNIVNSNNYGIFLCAYWYSSSSCNNTLTNNTMSNNDHNFGVLGVYLSNYNHNIDTTNKVDGKPVYYWVNQQNQQIPDDAGYVGIVNSTNITVKDLTITNNSEGVLFAYTNNSRIENVNALNNDYGILLYSSSNSTLSGNNVTNNGYGIRLRFGVYTESDVEGQLYLLYSSSNNTLTGNTASNNGDGICLEYSSNSTLSYNNVTNNGYGIILYGVYTESDVEGQLYLYSSSNNTLMGNTASNNDYGILLDSSSNNTLTINTASNNGYGIHLELSSSNTLSGNTASNNDYGILLDSSSNNTISSNDVSSNGRTGISLYYSDINFIYNNYFNNTNNAFDDGTNIWNTTKTAGTNIIGGSWLGGNYWSDYAGEDLDGDGLGDTLLPYNSSGNITTGGDWLPLLNQSASITIYVPDDYTTIQEAVNAASPGDTIIVRDGTYTGNINVNKPHLTIRSENGSDKTIVQGLQVIADYVNISGFTVKRATPSIYYSYAGIVLYSADYCNIANNNASSKNHSFGIHLSRSSSNTLTGNTASNNGYYGIYLQDSSSNTLTGNNASNNYGYGIRLYNSYSNTLTGNNASNNSHGIYLDRSSSNTLMGNTMSGNRYNFGVVGFFIQNIDTSNKVDGKTVYYWVNERDRQIPNDAGFVGVVNSINITVNDLTLMNNFGGVLFVNTGNSRIENVTASNNSYGIYLDRSSSNTLTDNNASNNSHGIYLYSSYSNTLTSNTASNNYDWHSHGIDLYYSHSNTLRGNTASNNNRDGISLDYSYSNTLTSNTASNNNRAGTYLSHSSSNTLSGNNASNNTRGIDIWNSCNNTLRGNTASNNNRDGISLSWSSNNTLRGNTASNNNRDGIYLRSSSSNKLTGNNASNHLYHGIYLMDSSSNTLTGNTASNNGYGIHLYSLHESSDNNDLLGNIIANNTNRGVYISVSSSNNSIHSNSFIENRYGTVQAYDAGSNNRWNTTDKGNYWSDYTTRYPSATNDTMVWATPYGIDGSAGAADNYPLVNPAVTGFFIYKITPNYGPNITTTKVTIFGTGFTEGVNVSIVKDGEEDIEGEDTEVLSKYQITTKFNLTGQTTGRWDVVAKLSGGEESRLTEAFEIRGFISGIFPEYGFNVTKGQRVTVYGFGFTDGVVVNITKEGEADIEGEDTVVLSNTRFTTNFNLTERATGLWDVVVTLPIGEQDSLPEAFEILDAAGDVYLLQTITIEAGESQEYAIPVPETNNLFITLQKSTLVSRGNSWRGKLSLLHDGEEIASASGSHDHILHVVDPEPGVYIIKITADQGGSGILTVGTALPELPFGEWVVGTIYCCYGSVWYQVEVPPDQDDTLYLEAEALGEWSHFDIYYEEYGSSEHWWSPDAQDDRRTSIEIPNPAPGTYIVEFIDTMTIGGFLWESEDQTRDVLIKADTTFSYEPPPDYLPTIARISPDSGGNTGFVTVEIKGGWLDSNATVSLVRSGYEDIIAQRVSGTLDGTTLSATFNLQGEEPGERNLVVANPDGRNATAPGSFTIEEGGASELWVEIVGREKVRVGRPAKYIIRYGNSGEVDMLAPLFIVSCSSGALLRCGSAREFTEGPIQILGVSFSGPVGMLRPGASYSIPVYLQTYSEDTVRLRVSTMIADETPINWTEVEAQIRPETVDSERWDYMWTNITSEIGNTWADYLSFLGQTATYLGDQGRIVYSVKELFFFEVQRAYKGWLHTGSIGGTVYYSGSNQPVEDVNVMAWKIDGGGYAENVTDEQGIFLLQHLPPGTYEITAEGYILAETILANVSEDECVTGLELYVQSGGKITGTVSEDGGDILSDVLVFALDSDGESVYIARTNETGYYEIIGLPADTFTVSCAPEGYIAAEVEVHVESGEVYTGADFLLLEGGTITGQVVSSADGTPIENAWVIATNTDGESLSAITNESGDYTIGGVSTGEWDLQVFSDEFLRSNATVSLTAPETVEVDFTLEPGASISGTVVNETDAPITNATIFATGPGNSVGFAMSNESGHYELTGLGLGIHNIQVEADGYAAASRDTQELDEGDSITGFDFTLAEGYTVRGIVTEEDGLTPIADAELTFYGNTGSIEVVWTDINGTFCLNTFAPDVYYVRISADGYSIVQKMIEVSKGSSVLDFNVSLPTGVMVTGSVTASDGITTINEAIVQLRTTNSATVASTLTDTNGHYAFYAVPSASYSIAVTHSLYSYSPEDIAVSGTSDIVCDFSASSGGLYGTVRSATTNETLSNATVTVILQTQDLYNQLVMQTETDAFGVYSFDSLIAGDYLVVGQKEGFGRNLTEQTISASGTVELDFNLTTSLTLSGVVKDSQTGQPIDNTSVWIVNASWEEYDPGLFNITNEEGGYSLSGLSDGEYVIRVWADGYVVNETTIAIVSDMNNDLLLSSDGYILSGKVVDTTTGVPIAYAVVFLRQDRRLMGISMSGTHGEFEFNPLNSGTYEISAAIYGSSASQIVSINEDTVVNLTLEINPMVSSVAGIGGKILETRPLGERQLRFASIQSQTANMHYSYREVQARSHFYEVEAENFARKDYPDSVVDLGAFCYGPSNDYLALIILPNKLAPWSQEILLAEPKCSLTIGALEEHKRLERQLKDMQKRYRTLYPKWYNLKDELYWKETNWAQWEDFKISAWLAAFTSRELGAIYALVISGHALHRSWIDAKNGNFLNTDNCKDVSSKVESIVGLLLNLIEKSCPYGKTMTVLISIHGQMNEGETIIKNWIATAEGLLIQVSDCNDLAYNLWLDWESFKVDLKVYDEINKPCYQLSLAAFPDGSGNITAEPKQGSMIKKDNPGVYLEGQKVKITAKKKEGYVFDHWVVNGYKRYGTNMRGIIIDRTTQVSAYFRPEEEEDEKPDGIPEVPSTPEGTMDIDPVSSATPEDKYGPTGFDSPDTPPEARKRFVPADQNYYYKIDFWNKENATAPACDVFVNDQLDANFNSSTLRFEEIGFLNWTVELEPCQYFNVYVDTRPEMDLIVNVEGVFDPVTGTLNWTFWSLDPDTLETPEDPMAGFLPPITESGYEIGWVCFSVDAESGLTTGTQVRNQAFVEFDWAGDLLDHPAPKEGPFVNTIDAGKPSSNITATLVNQTKIHLSMTGTDDAGGSGIRDYTVYGSEDGGVYVSWLDNVAGDEAIVYGLPGHSYDFYSVARDNVGNMEEAPEEADATVVCPITEPTVNITNPLDGAEIWYRETIDVEYTVSDICDPSPTVVVTPSDPIAAPLTLGELTITVSATDTSGNTGSDSVIVTVIGPMDLKEQAIAELEAAKTGDKKIDKEIDTAIEHIQKSLEDKLWVDGLHLDTKHGKKVFDTEKNAVKHLMKLCKCKGIVDLALNYTGSGTVDIRAYDKARTTIAEVPGASNGDCIFIDGATLAKGKLGAETTVKIYDNATGTLIDTQKIHTSCSKPLDEGVAFGDLEVTEVSKIIDPQDCSTSGIIKKLVQADEGLAKTAIDDAKATTVTDPKKQDKVDKEIAKAKEELAKAEDKLNEGKSDKAIDHYKKAWEHAQHAIKHA